MGSPNVPYTEINSFKSKGAKSGTKAPVVPGPASSGASIKKAPKR